MKANMSHDIEKEIHYFTLAANKNELQALFYLGSIRYESQYNTFNKLIFLHTLKIKLIQFSQFFR